MKNLKNIIITHYDEDHLGALYDFKVKYPQINVFASEIESNYISGDIKIREVGSSWKNARMYAKWRKKNLVNGLYNS